MSNFKKVCGCSQVPRSRLDPELTAVSETAGIARCQHTPVVAAGEPEHGCWVQQQRREKMCSSSRMGCQCSLTSPHYGVTRVSSVLT